LGIGIRIFIVNDDDSIKPLALARYDRLLQRDPNEQLTEYTGKRVRYALVVVDLVDREPVEILRIQYSYLSFDSEGRIDPAEGEREARLLLEILPPEPIIRYPLDIVEPKRSLPKKCHDDEHKWMATPDIEAAIVEAIFG
jgi:hypothetical protein